jgi:hypothetical protein
LLPVILCTVSLNKLKAWYKVIPNSFHIYITDMPSRLLSNITHLNKPANGVMAATGIPPSGRAT